MTRTIVDIHVLQTVPPSNLNRDDTGSPKTAWYGGVRRARVSSQAWKRATRKDFERTVDAIDLGVRSKRVVELLGDEIRQQSPETSKEDAHKLAAEVLTAGGIKLSKPRKGEIEESGFLLFLSHQQVTSLAGLVLEASQAGTTPDGKTVKALFKDKNSIDLAMFGRMVANITDLNVDASVQVAHALSVHAVEAEFDYFTAVDDHKADDADEDAGAGMIGTVEFNSSTLYRYATVDVDLLQKNLGQDAPTDQAVATFVRSFVRSMPTGKQNTFANRTLPDAVVVTVRSDQSVSYVGAFEEPVLDAETGGRVTAAANALAGYAKEVTDAFGGVPEQTWVVSLGSRAAALDALGERVSFDDLLSGLEQTVAGRLGGTA
ncbi:type I-E CRISPR-associated protein Cas7/Cse4/CasC [Promicromonospora sp. NFX87]|uniref:type I-E CRISPR-associated protein Cas7/Cse4/CasC n=1 Tax=Promicromonospora sp. NFX87 TaxID=3402691 RepID=UPI003AFB11AC